MLLSLAIWVPIFAGLAVFATGADAGDSPRAPLARWLALARASLLFRVTIPLWPGFDVRGPCFQFVVATPWIERFSIFLHLGVHGISVLFVLLNSFIPILVVVAGWSVIENRVGQY